MLTNQPGELEKTHCVDSPAAGGQMKGGGGDRRTQSQ